MVSLQEQIAFVTREQERCKQAYIHLQEEFGSYRIQQLGKELRQQIRFTEAILTSLQELQNLR